MTRLLRWLLAVALLEYAGSKPAWEWERRLKALWATAR